MPPRLFTRRTLWWPTWLGWLCLGSGVAALAGLWIFLGESFLSGTQRVPADVLVVEGWIGRPGMAAALEEFESNGYRVLVATGGYTGEGWMDRRWSYAEMAERELVRLGFPKEHLLRASAEATDNHRTFASAVAAREAIGTLDPPPTGVNVFTRGMHARRSRLVFARVLGNGTRVGVVSWSAEGSLEGPWWRSSDRAKDLITETAGYWFELFVGSGRGG